MKRGTEMRQPEARVKVQTLLAFSSSFSNQFHQETYQDMGLEKHSPDHTTDLQTTQLLACWAGLCKIQKKIFQDLSRGPIKVIFLRPSTTPAHVQLYYVFYKWETEPWKRGNELDLGPWAGRDRARMRDRGTYVHPSYPALRLKQWFDKRLVCPKLLFQPYQTS